MSIIKKIYHQDYYDAYLLVDHPHEGMRLDQFMQVFLDSFSREMIKKKIKDKEVKIVGRPGVHRPSTVLHAGEEIIISFPRLHYEDEYWERKKLDLQLVPEIVHEDQDLIVISKPAFMSTHPVGRHVFNCATVFFEIRDGKPVHSVHRLDRETSGILMLGRHPQMAIEVMEFFERDEVKKCYFFIGRTNENFKGEIDFEARERLDSPDEGLKRVIVHYYPEDASEGKHARTIFKILHQEKGYVLGLAFPQTGRQHQIRVHALAHGFPFIGDKLYLGGYPMFQRFKDQVASVEDYALMEIPRHALHALALQIPYKGKWTSFISHIPQDLKQWILKNMTIEIEDFEKRVKNEVEAYFERVKK